MGTPDKPSRSEIPAPDPKKSWALNVNDRKFLKSLKIDSEDERTPYESKDTEEDGA